MLGNDYSRIESAISKKMTRVRNCQHPQLEGAKWYQMPSILVNLGPWWDKLAWTMGHPWYSCLALRMPFSYGAFSSSWTKHPSPTTPKIRRLRNTGCWNGRVLSSFGMDHSATFGAQDMSLIHWHCLDYGSYGLLKIMSTCCGKQSGCCINQARKGHLLSQCLRRKTQKKPRGQQQGRHKLNSAGCK